MRPSTITYVETQVIKAEVNHQGNLGGPEGERKHRSRSLSGSGTHTVCIKIIRYSLIV